MRVLHRTAALVLAAAGVLAAVCVAPAARAAPAPAPALTAAQAAFLAAVIAPARASQRRYGVPASAIIAQAILETGWGGSALARTANNYFGMTCQGGRPGAIAAGCRQGPDRHCDSRGCRAGTATFRVYRSVGDSFRDHGRQLATMRRYATAYAARRDPNRFVAEMHRAGYATDPRYVGSITRIMVKYDLYRYNRR
jgi:flagellar protein FlgJ